MIFKKFVKFIILVLVFISSIFLGSCTRVEIEPIFEFKQDCNINNNLVNHDFVMGYNKTAIKTSQRIFDKNSGPVVFSPLGFFSNLAMISAADQSQSIIYRLFDTYADESLDIIDEFKALYYTGTFKDKIAYFQVYNSLWLNKKYQNISITKEYEDFLKKNFYASIYQIDFSVEEEKEFISKWIEEKSNGRITEFKFPDSNVDALFLNITNLKAPWAVQWREGESIVFYGKENKEIDAIEAEIVRLPVLLKEEYVSLELPLDYEMKVLIVMPKYWENLSSLIEEDFVEIFREKVSIVDAVIRMPKIKIKSEIDLIDLIKDFVLDNDQELKISAEYGFNQDIYIQSAQQQSYLTWDQNGIDISSVTSIETIISPEFDLEITIDKPFVFFILDRSNAIVFSGKYE